VTICDGQKAWLPCSALQQVNISQVGLIKWQVRRTLGSKNWTELAELKSRRHLNGTSLSTDKIDSVGLEHNGSLFLKNVSEINGDFECIVKTKHDHEAKRSSVHVIVRNCQRMSIFPTRKVMTSQGTQTITQEPQEIQSSTSTPQEAHSRKFTAQRSTFTPQIAQNSIQPPQVAQTKTFDTQVAQPTTMVRHVTGPFQNTTTSIVIGPSMVTTTSSWSKPSVTPVQTTVVTTVTTSVTTADPENRHVEQTGKNP